MKLLSNLTGMTNLSDLLDGIVGQCTDLEGESIKDGRSVC